MANNENKKDVRTLAFELRTQFLLSYALLVSDVHMLSTSQGSRDYGDLVDKIAEIFYDILYARYLSAMDGTILDEKYNLLFKECCAVKAHMAGVYRRLQEANLDFGTEATRVKYAWFEGITNSELEIVYREAEQNLDLLRIYMTAFFSVYHDF